MYLMMNIFFMCVFFDYKEQKDIATIDFSASPVKLDEKNCLPSPDIQYEVNMHTEPLRFYRKNRKRKLTSTDEQLWLRFS